MPANGSRSHRKGQFSCDFCRSRKLRCDRPLPCANCVSRGKDCTFAQQNERNQSLRNDGTASVAPPPPPLQDAQSQQAGAPDQGALLAEMQALRGLVEELQKRVTQMPSSHQNQASRHASLSLSASPSSSSSARVDESTTPSAGRGQVGEVVAHLELVSMGQSSNEAAHVESFVFREECIRAIPHAQPWQYGNMTHCIWLPQLDEARILVDKFISNVSYIHHVLHHPSLYNVIDDVYRQIRSQEPVQLGLVILLLSIFASVTNLWGPHNDQIHGESPLFSSSAQANAQTDFWIKQTYEVLESDQSGPPHALETVQGIVILSFLICNTQGVLLRYRSLISLGLLLSRELGIHWTDREAEFPPPNTIRVEMGRRVWWYLVATDWLLAARGGPAEGVYLANPKQMRVKKPRNINDVDLVDGGLNLDLPITQPTDMSYFLQRIRLAEISRGIVDQQNGFENSNNAPIIGPQFHDAQFSAINSQLDQMVQGIPPFLHLDHYKCSSESTTSGIFVQAYLLNSILHTQRCKLHLRYLASKPNDSPVYAMSRETCLKSARQIIRAEAQLESSCHPFALIRLRLSGILLGVFLAGIVLLMDICVNAMRSQQEELHWDDDAAEALRIIDAAKCYSFAAANLHKSLMQVITRYREQQHQKRQLRLSQLEGTLGPVSPIQAFDSQTPVQDTSVQGAPAYQNISQDLPPTSNGSGILPNAQTPYFDSSLGDGLEGLMELDGFQWDDLFSGIESASFF